MIVRVERMSFIKMGGTAEIVFSVPYFLYGEYGAFYFIKRGKTYVFNDQTMVRLALYLHILN